MSKLDKNGKSICNVTIQVMRKPEYFKASLRKFIKLSVFNLFINIFSVMIIFNK